MEIPTTLNSILFYYFYLLVFFCSSFHFCHASDTILPGQSLTREQTLISPGEKFVLGFFTPGKSQNLYIGIWFNKIQPLTVVWVANRKNPITDSSIGVLQFTNNGNLVVLSNTTILWSTDISVPARSAKLLDSGNLVLLDGNNSGTFLWQSFDYPTDTYIPGMKIGRNLKTNLNWSLTSWRTSDDPSPGNFTLELDISGLPHFLILKGNDIYWSAGLWDGQGWSGVAKKDGEYIKDHNFISNSDEVYYIDSVYNRSVIYRVFLDKTGVLQQATWNEAGQVWMLFWSGPRSSCQLYGACGPFGVCNADALQFCRCLSGFVPKHQRDWEMNKWSSGCVRETALKCGKEDGLLRLSGFKLPDIATNAQVDGSLSLNECREKCLNSCSCTAYASSDVQGGGSGCVIWSGDLIDLQNASQGHQEFYLRLSASELGTTNETRSSRGSFTRKMTLAFAIATPLFGILLLVVWCRCSCVRNKKKKKIQGEKGKEDVGGEESSEFTLFNFCTIEAATDNFSDTNKLGEGGFGPVYKGKMENGLEIAVKRLSKSSGQGMVEFENEVRLMAKLQHRNLVRLLGCCTHGEEKILIYEYMPNKSLDSFLFDHTVSSLLDWKKRFNIIIGIARGILYLHEDSRLRIIHRDLKCSNILLDAEMNPKISDFGMARRFGRNQSKANTKKVVGTFGYMSPEYAMRGIFSEKSDIFSFGVLVLEIVSGEKSNGFYNESLSLTGYGWKLWKEGRASEFMDSSLRDSCSLWEVLRCIHIGLLCVQESPRERPNMSSILFMLSSEIDLTTPDKPAFSILTEADLASIRPKPSSTNNVTISVIEAR